MRAARAGPAENEQALVAFHTALGWMALIGAGGMLRALTFGHQSAAAAMRALDPRLPATSRWSKWERELVERLRAYAAGVPEDFHDVPIDHGPLTPFRSQVVARCRLIPYGQTRTYGALAAEAGYPGAARAVGTCMATNRCALVVPCHRVVPAGGRFGAYSAPGGVAMKTRLLAMERAHAGF